MLIPLKHKLSLWISVVVIAVVAAITVVSCMNFGIEVGLVLGFFAFLLLGGFEAAWYLITRRMERRIDEKIDRDEVSRAYDASRNNPTIR